MNKNLLTIVILLALVGSVTNVNTADRKRKASHSSDEEKNAARQHKCHACGYSTTCKSNLTRHHMYMHTGERPFKCPVKSCNHSAVDQSSLTRHMYTHTEERRFKCPVKSCNHSTTQKSNLTRHMLIHASEKPFKCSADGCPYETADQSDFTRHMRRHIGEKSFKCSADGCPYETANRSDITKHMHTHTGEKPFKCPVKGCSHSSADKSNLTKHIKGKHAATTDHNKVGAAAHDESVAKQALPMLSGTVVNDANEDDNTQLQAAMEEGAERVQALLATQNINVNAIDQDGCTALHFATLNCHTEIVKALLLTPGINVNATDFLGYTTLHLAALLGRTEVVQALLEHGANTTLALIDGSTAADVALTEEICQLIEEAAARQQ